MTARVPVDNILTIKFDSPDSGTVLSASVYINQQSYA